MVEYTILDKICNVFNLIFSSPLFLILLFGILLMFLDIKFISKKSKNTKRVYFVISIIVIALLLHSYFDSLLGIFDTIAKNIVAIIYFPSVLEYIVMLLISLIIVLISIFNKKITKRIKYVNSSVFSINLFLFFLILDQINQNEIDLSNKVSIYSNDNLMMLFELSIAIFAVWIIGLTLYRIIYKINHKKEITKSFYEEPVLPNTLEELRKKEILPEPLVEYIVVEKKSDNDMFTLEEYKQMKAILEKMKKNQNITED